MGNLFNALNSLKSNIFGSGEAGSTTPILRKSAIELADTSPLSRMGDDPFQFSSISYPRDVTNDMQSGHYMLFYINKQNDTKYSYDGQSGVTVEEKNIFWPFDEFITSAIDLSFSKHGPMFFDNIDSVKLKIHSDNKDLFWSKKNIKNGYLRPFAWRGSEMMAISAQNTTIHLAIATWEMSTYFDKKKKISGITLQTSKWMKPPPNSAPTQAKAAGLYMICTLSKNIAEKNGFDDSLMLDSNGKIAESTGANIFFVKNNKLFTPIADCFLNGITRKTVIQLAKKNNIKVIEKRILPKELVKADEIFLTGTAVEITPVSQVDNRKYKIGEITKKLISLFSDLVEKKNSN